MDPQHQLLNTAARKTAIFFTGIEVEQTKAYGMQTLFVVGPLCPEDISTTAKTLSINHIYLGASQSFNFPIDDQEEIQKWNSILDSLLHMGFIVTLDFGVEYAEIVANMELSKYADSFIPMISVKLPNVGKFNKNATLKIDDLTWGHTNPGVWCHSLDTLTSTNFTPWDSYSGDIPVFNGPASKQVHLKLTKSGTIITKTGD